MKFNYLSHGKYVTGGFLYEKFYAECLLSFLRSLGYKVDFKQTRKHKFYDTIFAHFELMFTGWKYANADLNLLVARFAIPVLFRALFSSNRYILVFHYEDENDKSSFILRFYYRLFFGLLNLLKPKNLAILVVAPFWEDYFKSKLKHTPILYFPNLFNLREYQKISVEKKTKQIHLGQWSWKNDPMVFQLADKLFKLGYNCYFSTNNLNEAGTYETYEIIAENRNSYLTRMAASSYTIAFTSINEGWNRLAHESLLLNTPVIGLNRGGLGNLLQEADCFIVENTDQALEIIQAKKVKFPSEDFINKYSELNANNFLESSVNFIIT